MEAGAETGLAETLKRAAIAAANEAERDATRVASNCLALAEAAKALTEAYVVASKRTGER
jgi:hypothetical protein